MNTTQRLTLPELARLRVLCRSGQARAIRAAARLSTGEVATEVGVTKTAVHHWETGGRSPSRSPAAARYLALLDQLAAQREVAP